MSNPYQPYGQQPGQSPYSQPSVPPGYTVPPMPPKKRGTKRIIFGAIMMVLGFVGAIVGIFLGPIIGGAFSAVNADAEVQFISSGETIDVKTGFYMVAQQGASGCTATADPSEKVEIEQQSGELPVQGESFNDALLITSLGDAKVTITCDGASKIAVLPASFTPIIVGLVLGIALPVLFGAAGLILLISGLVGRSRSSRGH